MGNFIKTKNGTEISLSIPAKISSFAEQKSSKNSHITKGKLKVFSVGNTGDIREFTREFSEDLIASLPGTPVVAHYIEDKEDFEGHDSTQYVYGYVPENAVPEFVEEGNQTWAVVDVNLFTERKDNIGQVASKIIGKAQSLELNPETVDYEMIYINNKLEKIKFKKGSFYGLSVLGDDQPPAFEGAGFFTKEIIDEFKSFDKPTDFMSLGINDKIELFYGIINKMNLFECYYISDFTEEQIIVSCYDSGKCEKYAASYSWEGEDKYLVGEFKKVMVTYTETETSENFSEDTVLAEPKVETSIEDGVNYKKEEDTSSCGNCADPEEKEECNAECGDKKETECACGDADKETKCECGEPDCDDPEEDKDCDDEGCGDCACGDKKDCGNCEASTEPTGSEDVEKGKDEEKSEEKFQEQKEELSNIQNSSAEFAALSSEEREELNALRTEKKQTLINSFKEFLDENVIKDFESKINEFDFNSLEKELKIASFDSNKERMNKNENTTINTLLPHPTSQPESRNDRLARLVSENI